MEIDNWIPRTLEHEIGINTKYTMVSKYLKQAHSSSMAEPTAKPPCCSSACDSTTPEKINAKDKEPVIFAPSDRSPDDIVSNVTQSDSTTMLYN